MCGDPRRWEHSITGEPTELAWNALLEAGVLRAGQPRQTELIWLQTPEARHDRGASAVEVVGWYRDLSAEVRGEGVGGLGDEGDTGYKLQDGN